MPLNHKQTNQIRIIGGKWRSRKLNFLDREGLRPTPNRLRETLFNWLSPCISDATCLDLFAGSGALGFEALSRGARSVVMLDACEDNVEQIKKNSELLNVTSSQLTLYCGDVLTQIECFQDKFDIVFLDPPFHKNMIEPTFARLKEAECLSKNALIYVEAERALTALPLLDDWKVIRHKIAGSVSGWLIAT